MTIAREPVVCSKCGARWWMGKQEGETCGKMTAEMYSNAPIVVCVGIMVRLRAEGES